MEGKKIKALTKWKYCPPWIIKALFRSSFWNTVDGKILLTFDDGPNPETTPLILDCLNTHSIETVFFCTGVNLEKYPLVAKAIIDEGHAIANHTFNHKSTRSFWPKQPDQEIIKFNELHQQILGVLPRYYRPPFGRITPELSYFLKKHNMKNIMWSLFLYDYKNDLNIVKFAVRNFLAYNSIIVLHDNVKCKEIIVDSIDYIVDTARQRGYSFGNPGTCLN